MTITKVSYKDSGIAWIGQIPDGWKVKRLKYIANIDTGYTPPKADPENYSEDGMPRIKPDNLDGLSYLINSNERISQKGLSGNPVIEKDDIMVCCIGTVGKMGVAGCKVTFNQQINSVSFTGDVNKQFGKFMIMSSQEEHLRSSQNVVVPILNKTKQSNIYFVVPPLPTQTIIADYLDTKTTQIKEFITKKKQIISLLQEQKQAIIHQAVTKGIDPSAKMKDSGIVWIGETPEGWEVSKLKFIFKYITGATPDSGKGGYYGGDNNWITISDLDGKYTGESKNKITDLAVKEKNMKIVPKGSLLYSFKLSVGQLAFVSEDTYTNEAIFAILEKEGLNLDFWYYALGSYFINNANENIYGAKIFNQFVIDNGLVIVPPFQMQNVIVKYIESRTSKIDQAIAKIEQEIDLIQEYRTSLIYHAVTGKININ